jgi:ribose transport system permease protein
MNAGIQAKAPPPTPTPTPARRRRRIGPAEVGELLRSYAIVVAFMALFITLSLASDVFLTKTNLLNLLDQNSDLLIVSAAMTVVIIAGGFDLSVGAIYAIAGVLSAKVAISTGSDGLGVLAGLAAGGVLGLGNGLLVTVGRINSFIGTLATGFLLRGVALVITGGTLITVENPSFLALGSDSFLGIKYTIWIMLAVVLSVGFLLTQTIFGRHVYAVGGNVEAARLSGVRVNRVRALAFVLSGFCAALAGILIASRVGTGQADAAPQLELTAIAAVVIGGTSISGGEGAIWRTALGVFLLAFINNGFNLLNVDVTYQQVVLGAIIILAVGIDAWSRRKA